MIRCVFNSGKAGAYRINPAAFRFKFFVTKLLACRLTPAMKSTWILFLFLFSHTLSAPHPVTRVLTLETFHFSFPNLDVAQVATNDQIDVFDPRHQEEIELIVEKISLFKPTIIVIERQVSKQHATDSAYHQYVAGQYQLKRNEEEQIGFRLAKRMGLTRLYCLDTWRNFLPRTDSIVFSKDSAEAKKFETFYETNPDEHKRFNQAPVFTTKGKLAALRQANDEENIKKSLGNYLIGPFKYESRENDFTGVDFETGRWFSRNLKIFRNIQRIQATPSDRILVLFGAGHMNLLNYFFDCSPEHQRASTNDFLR